MQESHRFWFQRLGAISQEVQGSSCTYGSMVLFISHDILYRNIFSGHYLISFYVTFIRTMVSTTRLCCGVFVIFGFGDVA